ncbi:MAG: hypothetical protein JSR47_24975 [Proteobacteria bacterium]|nr:hypothetical protein [Pseudomonadota bacterium]MBS0548177.1 hypothetical protein [Pseudomonadota bacterium]
MTQRVYERDTDALFLRGFRERGKFAAHFARLVLGEVPAGEPTVEAQIRHVGSSGTIDIVVRYPNGPVLMIENKIDAGYSVNRQGHSQPQRYRATVAAYRARGAEVHSILLAPQRYLKSSRSADMFDKKVTYESLCAALEVEALELLEAAILQSEEPYEPTPNQGAGNFFSAIRELIREQFPDLHMQRDPNANGVRPKKSRTVYFDCERTLAKFDRVKTPRMSLQCWDSAAPSASVKIMMGGLAQLAEAATAPASLVDVGGYLRRAGQSLGIVIDTPRLDTQRPLNEQIDDVVEALEGILRLQKWWAENGETLRKWSSLRV